MLLGGCEREARRFGTPAQNSSVELVPRESGNQPGLARAEGVRQAAVDRSPYERNAHAVAQGKRLYTWFNCAGCHGGGGGGGIGPPLMDDEWRYGSDPASIFDTIMKGRPNGMPSYGGHIPDDQVWQLVADVQSMSGGLRADVAPDRVPTTLFSAPPQNARPSRSRGRVRGSTVMIPHGLHDALQAMGPQAAHILELWRIFLFMCTGVTAAIVVALRPRGVRRACASASRRPCAWSVAPARGRAGA